MNEHEPYNLSMCCRDFHIKSCSFFRCCDFFNGKYLPPSSICKGEQGESSYTYTEYDCCFPEDNYGYVSCYYCCEVYNIIICNMIDQCCCVPLDRFIICCCNSD